ncbi:MAG: sulfurtransferase [Bacteroidetes bacterium 24-39-8]|jgi:rhodanese-related sulfurtransferase|nr:MAG: sulfurtransferase [Sphingobacteriia bacterium 35-40-8]OYZ51991.1 MAG: sulfurtransferase [Bacteroidetes bacterium 24-39-8]OZA66556.1 MAG: sulfurtransferase [Sphingobacteriia bacterium 39-39-8]HQR91837.1 rhodanese-like domain-containing protein [Sediminibacterium sp.]HQS56287.1 rhodanese-like domain-containing protein [Sediminibacterium sp.]
MELKQSNMVEICPTTTRVWIKRGAILVDVREKSEVAELAFDVPNLIQIPLTELEDRYLELPLDQEMVIACRAGGKSLLATSFLINHGYDPTKVVNMKHGMVRWAQKGFPTIGDTTNVLLNSVATSCCHV